MKIIIFTSNAIRHKYVANLLTQNASEALIISECKKSDAPTKPRDQMTLLEKSFADRFAVETTYFAGNDTFHAQTLPLLYKEVNALHVLDIVRAYKPDIAFVFGASIIGEPLIREIPAGRFINMHLGLSPYYRGSGTNFWPFINEELEYVGATLLHIDPGIDTGDIVAHVRPEIEMGDTVHTIGCKTIQAAANGLVSCLKRVERGEELPRTPQWEVQNSRYYKTSDITESAMETYSEKIEGGLINQHLEKTSTQLRIINL